MQMMATRPARCAAAALACTMASVSLWLVRRSECPTITMDAPASFSISAEMSPVWAPEAAAWQSCPPTLILPPFITALARRRMVAGGQTSTSHFSFTPFSMAPRRRGSRRAAVVPFIFQFPATRGRIAVSDIIIPFNALGGS